MIRHAVNHAAEEHLEDGPGGVQPPAELAPRSTRPAPRKVLLWAGLAILVALGLYAAAPWLLPVRLVEGPLVQLQPTGDLALVWYTSRAAPGAVRLETEAGEREFPCASAGNRHCVTVEGLLPSQSCTYRIFSQGRPLTRDLSLQTIRQPGERYSFLVFGDGGKGNRVQYRLAAEMERAAPAPDFVLHTGDLVYPDGARRRYEANFFAPYRALLARVPFLPCLGNHDVDDHGPGAYLSVFELPENGPAELTAERNYWLDYADARIVVVDSTLPESELARVVAPWLKMVLSEPGVRWRFVAFHHPPFTGGKYLPDLSTQRALVPVIEECGVDVVFNGHDHSYQRTHPLHGGEVVDRGTVYIITAAAGASLYQPKAPRPPYIAAINYAEYSYTRVVVEGPKLALTQIALGGHVIDEYVLNKTAAATAENPEQTSRPGIENVPEQAATMPAAVVK